MKPELSLQATGSLPSERTKSCVAAITESSLIRARTTSTSIITGTGLTK